MDVMILYKWVHPIEGPGTSGPATIVGRFCSAGANPDEVHRPLRALHVVPEAFHLALPTQATAEGRCQAS